MALILGSALTTFAGRSAGVALDDATITTKVKYELAEDVKFGTLKTVQVDISRGVSTVRNPDEAGVHNENDLKLLTRVLLKGREDFDLLVEAISALPFQLPGSNPARSERFFLMSTFAHTSKTSLQI